MVGQVNAVSPQGREIYTTQARRTAWREDMLAQFLEKAREVSPAVSHTRVAAPSGPPPKGSVVDVVI